MTQRKKKGDFWGEKDNNKLERGSASGGRRGRGVIFVGD